VVQAHRLRAEVAYARDDLPSVQAYLDQAAAAARACPDRRCRAATLITESRLEYRLSRSGPPRRQPALPSSFKSGQSVNALPSTPAGLPGTRSLTKTHVLYSVNEAAEAQRHRERSVACARAAINLARELGDLRLLAHALDEAGDHTTAATLHTQIGD
jgi:hypothetical protein